MRHAHQLALRLFYLVMQAAQHTPGRARMVVLHKIKLFAQRRLKTCLVETFKEKTAFVAVHRRLNQQHISNRQRGCFHQNTFSLRIRSRYCP